MPTQLTLTPPDDFSFQAVVDSHGWRDLAPFSFDKETNILTRIERLPDGDGTLVKMRLWDDSGTLQIEVEGIGSLSAEQEAAILAWTRRCLNIDQPIQSLYSALRQWPDYAWVEGNKLGRILIGPTVWEDLAKTLFTTNTMWAQTKGMCRRLCSLGDVYDAEKELYAFPTPQQIAAMPYEDVHMHVRAGYRTAYLHELAVAITAGDVDVESWYNTPLTGDELYKAIKRHKGFGDYAAGTMLRLLGHFDRIAIDTALRSAHAALYNGGEKADDKAIHAFYEQFGQWRGVVMWMDVMRS